MKKIIIFTFVYIGIGALAFSLFKISNKYQFNVIQNNMECRVVSKGCDGAQGIVMDEEGKLYIGYKDHIQLIDNDGKEKLLYQAYGQEIEDLAYKDGNIYFLHNDSFSKVSKDSGTTEVLRVGIPKGNNNIRRKLLVKDDSLLLSIGAISNSGIKDDGSLELLPIREDELGTAAIYEINLKDNKFKLFASGIRGITGMDVNSKGEIIGIFSGMKNEGKRPINRDKDYVYKIERNSWYGWPDYSGGDPINSPRFKGEEIVKPLIQKEQLRIIKAPDYQSDYLDSLREMAIDKQGKIFSKDSILFWNKSEQKICNLNENNIVYDILVLNKSSVITDIIDSKEGFYILDSGLGCIYQIKQKNGFFIFQLPEGVLGFLSGLVIIIIVIVIRKAVLKRGEYKR